MDYWIGFCCCHLQRRQRRRKVGQQERCFARVPLRRYKRDEGWQRVCATNKRLVNGQALDESRGKGGGRRGGKNNAAPPVEAAPKLEALNHDLWRQIRESRVIDNQVNSCLLLWCLVLWKLFDEDTAGRQPQVCRLPPRDSLLRYHANTGRPEAFNQIRGGAKFLKRLAQRAKLPLGLHLRLCL